MTYFSGCNSTGVRWGKFLVYKVVGLELRWHALREFAFKNSIYPEQNMSAIKTEGKGRS